LGARPGRTTRPAAVAPNAAAAAAHVRCPAEHTLGVIGGKWKVVILYRLFDGPRRFSELRRAMPGVTQKVLTQQLREMEGDGLVTRKVFAQVPPKVEYALTPLGRSLRPIVDAMCRWGSRRGKCG
jgi:DNA-binding HxlR family transcriptional regulator